MSELGPLLRTMCEAWEETGVSKFQDLGQESFLRVWEDKIMATAKAVVMAEIDEEKAGDPIESKEWFVFLDRAGWDAVIRKMENMPVITDLLESVGGVFIMARSKDEAISIVRRSDAEKAERDLP